MHTVRYDLPEVMAVGRHAAAIVLIALMLSACSTAAPLSTPASVRTLTPTLTRTPVPPVTVTTAAPTRTPTRTVTPQVVATTLTPLAQPVVACTIAATRTPVPSAPTFAPGGPGSPKKQVDPHVEICASATRLKVGETVTILGQPVDIGLPYYTLSVKDDGASEAASFEVTYENKARPPRGASRVFDLESARGEMNQAVFVLRAKAEGVSEIRISATGEIHYGYPGPAMWAGGGSGSILITVQAR